MHLTGKFHICSNHTFLQDVRRDLYIQFMIIFITIISVYNNDILFRLTFS